jgi:hypothetical protein
VWERTRIVDGDLSLLITPPRVRQVAMASRRRHYRPTTAEVENASRGSRLTLTDQKGSSHRRLTTGRLEALPGIEPTHHLAALLCALRPPAAVAAWRSTSISGFDRGWVGAEAPVIAHLDELRGA